MTPEVFARSRPVRDVHAFAGATVLFDEGGDALYRMENDRKPFEVLVTADRAGAFSASLQANREMILKGYWRRRSGITQDGRRHFIWTLVLVDWDLCAETLEAA